MFLKPNPLSAALQPEHEQCVLTVTCMLTVVCVCVCKLVPVGGSPSHSLSWFCSAPPGVGDELIVVRLLGPGRPAEPMPEPHLRPSLLLAAPEPPAGGDNAPPPSSSSSPPLPPAGHSSPEEPEEEELSYPSHL